MRDSADLGRLKTAEWDLLQELVDRFEDACRVDNSVDLSSHLPPSGDPLRLVALHELIKSDLEIRWRRNDKVELESYLQRFPELGSKASLPPKLIFEEYRVRYRHGDRVPLTSYLDRFPDQFPELKLLQAEQPVETVAQPGPTRPSDTVAQPAHPTPPSVDVIAQKTVSPDHNILPVGGGYKLIKLIGHGAFAEVWKAEAPGGFAVAVKRVFRPVDHEEAQRELEALNRIRDLSHPFLLATHAYHLLDGRLYVVMDLADGNLKDRLKQCQSGGEGSIPVPELVRYFEEAAEALDYMHSMHVIHRDIKPQNVLLHKGHVKVADFGLARMLESQRHMASASGSGTPVYMAPEIWQNQVSQHSDQYSLALTYAELRRGRRPFASSDMHGIMIEHLSGKPDLEGVTPEEQEVLMKALAKKPEDRFENCLAFTRALKRAAAVQFDLSISGSSPLLGSHSSERHRLRDSDATDQMLSLNAFETAPPGRRVRKTSPPTQADRGGQGSGSGTAIPDWREPAASPRRRLPIKSLLGLALLIAVGVAVWALWRPSPIVNPPAPPGGERKIVKKDDWKLVGDDVRLVAGKWYSKEIDVIRGDQRVRFILIHNGKTETDDDPTAFYTMQDKVSLGLFKKFAEQEGSKKPLANSEWLTTIAAKDYVGANKNDEQPVMGVVVLDAMRFAEWLGGRIPLPEQWDRAAGKPKGSAPGLGPFQGKWPGKLDIAIGREMKQGPMKCGEAKDDVSPTGCRDLAGNGLEWTGRVSIADSLEVPPTLEEVQDLQNKTILMRGARYTFSQPFLYEGTSSAEKASDSKPHIGFRVAIEPGK